MLDIYNRLIDIHHNLTYSLFALIHMHFTGQCDFLINNFESIKHPYNAYKFMKWICFVRIVFPTIIKTIVYLYKVFVGTALKGIYI